MADRVAPPEGKEELLRLLIEAGKVDTLYRDIYLNYALTILEPLLSPSEFQQIIESERQIDDFVRRSHVAADHGDWEAVREATARIGYLRSVVAAHETLLAAAQDAYHPADMVIDPFSPGLEWTPIGRRRRELGGRIVDILSHLVTLDGPNSPFYQERLQVFRETLPSRPKEEGGEQGVKTDTAHLQREALLAAERGDVASLDRLLSAMEDAGITTRREHVEKRPPEQRSLADALQTDLVGRASSFGMVAAEVPEAPIVSAFLWQRAWQPNIPDQLAAEEGSLRLLGADDIPFGVPDRYRDVLEMFLLHVFVNSCGVRYLPALGPERFLVEDFSEDDPDVGGPLLELLGLPKRRGLSRVTVETALLQRGSDILRTSFDVDPCRFRLVCIPFDLYARLGTDRGWGRQPLWTHFDGYQLLKGGGGRALVGGDVRYGGIYDLCSISDFDAREGVIARFAIVRRERMLISSR